MMSIFNFDNTMPALPVPELLDSCHLLKQMIKPLVSREAWEETCQLIDKFSEQNGEGEQLQKLLINWQDCKFDNTSWLRPIWDDLYLAYREELPINMNYIFDLQTERWGDAALAKLIIGVCHVIQLLNKAELPPESAKARYLSMEPLRNIIYTRIPGAVRDILDYPSLPAPLTAAAVCKGHWFILSLTDQTGKVVSPEALTNALNSIRQQTDSRSPQAFIGAMTSAKRHEELKVRDAVQSNLLNRMNLESIEKSSFVVCLDEPQQYGDCSRLNILGGDAGNRWFNKSLQIIAPKSGGIGMNFEHAGCDAGIWVYLLSLVDTMILQGKLPESDNKVSVHIRSLEWNIPAALTGQLAEMRHKFKEKTQGITVKCLKTTVISKEKIKALKCSPDAFVQFAYQAAYYKLTGKFRSVYEAVSTRTFYQGRTESVRPCTNESAEFTTAFVNNTASKSELLTKFRLAEKVHQQRLERSQKALGAERHMYGLAVMSAMYAGTNKYTALKQPAIFEDKGWQTLRHDVLSTSSITAPFVNFFGFGPVVNDGLGLGYGLDREEFRLMVSAFSDSEVTPEQFVLALEEVSRQFINLLE